MYTVLEELEKIRADNQNDMMRNGSGLSVMQELSAIRNKDVQNAVKQQATPHEGSWLDYPINFGLETWRNMRNVIRSVPETLLMGTQEDIDRYTNFRRYGGKIPTENPLEDSAVTEWVKSLATSNYNFNKEVDEAKRDFIGENPSFGVQLAGTLGSQAGYAAGSLLLGLGIEGLGLLSPTLSFMLGGAISGAGEGMTESAGIRAKIYGEDPTRWDDANKAAMYNLALNVPTDALIGAAEGKFSNLVGDKGGILPYLANMGINIAAETGQETKQEILGEAALKTAENGEVNLQSFGENLYNEIKKTPEYFAQVGPQTAAATAITQGILGLGGIGAKTKTDTATENTTPNAPENTTNNEELERLRADREAEIKIIENFEGTPEELEKEQIRLSNIENAINNFGKDIETIQAEKQAEIINNANLNNPVNFGMPENPIEPENAENIMPVEPKNNKKAKKNNKSSAQEEELRQNFKEKLIGAGRSDEEAEALSHVYIAGNKFFAKYTGRDLGNVINDDKINFEVEPDIYVTDKNGNVVNDRYGNPKRIRSQIEFNEAGTLIRISNLTDQSSILHETGHLFLRKFQTLARSGSLTGLAKQDWQTLVKAYDAENIDFDSMSDKTRAAWQEIQEKFATDLERYMMTGEAPNTKLQHVFEQFKRWLKEIYHSIKNIKYVGADGAEHGFELSPEVKKVFDDMLGEDGEIKVGNEDGQLDIFAPQQAAEVKTKGVSERIDVEDAPELATTDNFATQNENNKTQQEKNITRVRTMAGTEVDVRYRVIEAEDLITSNTDNNVPNPNYPQELQPRQRNRSASVKQIEDMSRRLDPELLAENRLASDGAPIVGPDKAVESGNGRVLGIRRAYKNNNAKHYRDWIIDNAGRFGINPEYIANMKWPVLVRERITDVDRLTYSPRLKAGDSSINNKCLIAQVLLRLL